MGLNPMMIRQWIEILQEFLKICFQREGDSETDLDTERLRKTGLPFRWKVGFHKIEESNGQSKSGLLLNFLPYRVP